MYMNKLIICCLINFIPVSKTANKCIPTSNLAPNLWSSNMNGPPVQIQEPKFLHILSTAMNGNKQDEERTFEKIQDVKQTHDLNDINEGVEYTHL